MNQTGDEQGRCGSCAAFTRVRTDEAGRRVGDCALEVFPPPVRAMSTCARYRPKGAKAPPPRPRAAGEPRGRAREEPVRATPYPLPSEVDIDMDIDEFKSVLKEVIAESFGRHDAPLGARWSGGEVVIKPGREGTQEKRIPVETLFHKIVMVRDKLRLLEAKVNSHPELSAEDKVQLQSYITGCYGSLTTFNVLFSEKDDQFRGAAKGD